MIRLYKNLCICYLISAIVALAALCVLELVIKLNILGIAVFAALYLLALFVSLNRAASNRYNREVNSLLYNCHISDYIAQNEALLAKSKNRTIRDFLMLNLVGGYYEFGSMEQAAQMLAQINPDFGTKPVGVMSLAVYYVDLALLSVANCEYEPAKEALASLQSLLDNPELKGNQKADIEDQIEEKTLVLEMEQGNFEGAKEYFTEYFASEIALLNKVNASYHLANICLHYEENQEALEHLHFVIENGGDTYYVGKAKELLSQITANT